MLNGRSVDFAKIILFGVPEARKRHSNQMQDGHPAPEERNVVVFNFGGRTRNSRRRDGKISWSQREGEMIGAKVLAPQYLGGADEK